ncbi:DUF6982 domain-containing protein [Terriglobus saanensis]|uniref:Uncharacterized protein n=1 Tax=Terriglobus saanensis (strain ATCC BAA-1853 / DSM 23119 / SP1PR4) TaxID=401053 RepID=E8V3Z5_TERSS|nr:hypothetical protein [Terriglobus saanensis]ADV81409.1 hypothetical protein AciPR4_0574 [Terriglobus saanensis SP1PR4]
MPKDTSIAADTKVVIRYADSIIKGHFDSSHWNQTAGSSFFSPHSEERMMTITRDGSTTPEDVSIQDAKGIFFVNSFEGNRDHDDIRFHDGEPMGCLWVQITFTDGEVLEGMTENSMGILEEKGFYLKPTDPTGNNWLVFVMRHQIREFHILGLHKASSPGSISPCR